MVRTLIIAALLALLAAPVQAEDWNGPAYSAKSIDECWKTTPVGEGLACLGKGEHTCLDQEDTGTELWELCAKQELAVWESRLAATLRRAQKGARTPEARRAFFDEQAAWVESRVVALAAVPPSTDPEVSHETLIARANSRLIIARITALEAYADAAGVRR